jgi:DNA-directed RNA polymerase
MPVQLDYRGRLYCMTNYLNYQGIDLAKSLLEFSTGSKVSINDLDAINYLKIFGANCYGNKLNKESFDNRIKFIDENLENIINFGNGSLLEKAENKLLFLSFCFEFNKYYKAYKNNDSDFISQLPIQLDATCNGFQHLTFLIDDTNLSADLNLSNSNWSYKPKDFYNIIALKIQLFFYQTLNDKNVELSEEDRLSYQKLAKLDIHRSLIKKAVMTIPYNASNLSLVDYIKEQFISQPFVKNKHLELLPQGKSKYKNKIVYYLNTDLEQNIPNPTVFLDADFLILSNEMVFQTERYSQIDYRKKVQPLSQPC